MWREWSPSQEISAGVTHVIESLFVGRWLVGGSWSGIPTQLPSLTALSQDRFPAVDEGTPNNAFVVTMTTRFILPHWFQGQRQHT